MTTFEIPGWTLWKRISEDGVIFYFYWHRCQSPNESMQLQTTVGANNRPCSHSKSLYTATIIVVMLRSLRQWRRKKEDEERLENSSSVLPKLAEGLGLVSITYFFVPSSQPNGYKSGARFNTVLKTGLKTVLNCATDSQGSTRSATWEEIIPI